MINVETLRLYEENLERAVALIEAGEVVAFPTDTVYGLGADATDNEAVKKIFKAKGRPADRPLNVLVAAKSDLEKYAKDVPIEAKKLAEKFWPGPLTIILNKKQLFAPAVTGGLDTIGLRMPAHPLALAFIEACGVPLAAPSANSSGRPSPTTADHVFADLTGKIPAIIDGGATDFGIESTVLELSNPKQPIILRPGGVTQSEIEATIGQKVYTLEEVQQAAPAIENGKQVAGKHYEPTIPVYIVKTSWEAAISQKRADNEKVALLASDPIISQFENEISASFSLGAGQDIKKANQRFFNGLRTLEGSGATVILAEPFPLSRESVAYMNRLESAANGKEI